MGALQVPRVAAALALLGVAATAAAAGTRDTPEAIAVIDTRPPTAAATTAREAFAAALAGVNGVSVVVDERAPALAGIDADGDDLAATAALAEARDAFGALECGRARPAAEDAIRVLAGRQAAGLDERVRLRATWTYVLLCADRDGDRSMALAAADRLRALGGGEAVPADTWARYPEIDAATDRDIVELTVSAPAGAAVAIDHVPVGVAPVTRFVLAGKHVVAVAAGTRRGAALVTVHGKPVTVEVAAEERASSWRDVARQVSAWQGGAPPTPVEVTELMTRVGVRFAVVIGPRGDAALWARGPRQDVARLVIDGQLADPIALGAGVMARVEAWRGSGPDPDEPLLTERDAAVRAVSRGREPTRWWVYAVIGGAFAAGAVTIYALEAGDDRQIIDLTFPLIRFH